eukprot:m51a1_g7276 hypothetical protein (203) ;mRNA; f:141-807
MLAITRTGLRLLINCASLSLRGLQELLAKENLTVELYHLLCYLLAACLQLPAEGESAADAAGRESALADALLLMGYVALQNKRLQEMFHWGQPPSLLQTLCALPMPYFCNPDLKRVLFPTLVCLYHENLQNLRVMQKELDTELLRGFLAESASESPRAAQRLLYVPESQRTTYARDECFELENRFPARLVASAVEFLSSNSP